MSRKQENIFKARGVETYYLSPRWAYGYPIGLHSPSTRILVKDDGERIYVREETVGAYVGKDRRYKDVYVGDLLKLESPEGDRLGKIVMDGATPGMQYDDATILPINPHFLRLYEVVGNIHGIEEVSK